MPSEKLGVARSGRRVCARGAMPTKKKGGADCQLVALMPKQVPTLVAVFQRHWKEHTDGPQEVTCNACLQTWATANEGSVKCVIATEGHDSGPKTCLQAFWRMSVKKTKKMHKNGQIQTGGNGEAKIVLTMEDLAMAQKVVDAMSDTSKSVAPTAPGTPAYDPALGMDDDGEEQGGSSSKASPKAAIPKADPKATRKAAPNKPAPKAAPEAAVEVEVGVEDGDQMEEDEPKKRGRGRPKGSKNNVTPKEKQLHSKVIEEHNIVPSDPRELVAAIPERQLRFACFDRCVYACVFMCV